MFRIVLLSLTTLGLLVSCAPPGSVAWCKEQIGATRKAAEANNKKMVSLKIGQSKADILAIMGSPTKTECYDLGKGGIVEFYFYRTQGWSNHDLQDTDAQFTPVAFQNEKLVGWGRNYYEKVIRQQIDLKVSGLDVGTIPEFDPVEATESL